MIEFVSDTDYPVTIPCTNVELNGLLHHTTASTGIIIFVHGSGSGRLSPRNQYVAKELQTNGFSTLLFDLLTQEEEVIDTQTMEFRFDIDLLATRLMLVTSWVINNPILHKKHIGYFGASTGGAAALVAASNMPDQVKAVVSRGGRPDLAEEALKQVTSPTLLIVGGKDEIVIELNKKAMQMLNGVKELKIVPGATHLFEESGKLEDVAKLACQWFKAYL